MRCTENWNTCNQHWSTERARFLSMITPNCTSCNQRFKSWVNWVTKFSSSTIRTSPLTNRLPLFQASPQLFAEKMLPQLAGCRKCFPRVSWILKYTFLCYRDKNLFLVGKNVLIVMTLILINKDVFEPSYNDLKFMVRNRNYFRTKLILKMFYWNTAVPIQLPTMCDCFHPITA